MKGTIITSNKGLRSWAEVIHDSSLATALIDRLMHHGEVFYLSGDSYRLRGKKKLLEDSVSAPELGAEPKMEMTDCQVKSGRKGMGNFNPEKKDLTTGIYKKLQIL